MKKMFYLICLLVSASALAESEVNQAPKSWNKTRIALTSGVSITLLVGAYLYANKHDCVPELVKSILAKFKDVIPLTNKLVAKATKNILTPATTDATTTATTAGV